MADTQQADKSQPVCEAPQPAWEAKQYEQALAHLERLQEQVSNVLRPRDLIACSLTISQIDSMRRTIPSMIEPMRRPVKDKAQLFVQVKTAAVQAVGDVEGLRNSWNSDETQSLLTKSRESLAKDSDLSKAANVPRYGWNEDVEMG